MEVVYRCCAGVDVHKKSVTVNVLRRGVEGKEDLDEVRTFGTMSKNLFGLAAWVHTHGDGKHRCVLETDLQYHECRGL